MKHIALLRGINVGGNKSINMKRLRTLFESSGYTGVSTYLNSGNVIFNSEETTENARMRIQNLMKNEFGFNVPTIVRTEEEMRTIADAIPEEWCNDDTHKTDVAFLFPEIDSESTLGSLPIKREYIDIRYVKGAIIWNVSRKDYNKSHINKIIGQKVYQFMTIRNVNTARHLAGLV